MGAADGSALAIAGLGGFGRELAALVASGRVDGSWRLTGIYDDAPHLAGTQFAGIDVTTPLDRVRDSDAAVVVAVGNPRAIDVRRKVVDTLDLPQSRYATVVAADAFVGLGSRIGAGCVLMPGVVCTADVVIGDHSNVMPNCTLTHDVTLGECVAVGSGVHVAGGVTIGDGAYIGSGALVREGVTVGAGALIGMGAVVLTDVPAGQVWAGSPARKLR